MHILITKCIMVQSCCGFAWYRSHISGMQPCSIVGTRNTLHWRVHTKNMFCVAQHYMIFLYCLFKACVTKFMLVMFALVDALWRSKNFHKISVDGTLGQNNGDKQWKRNCHYWAHTLYQCSVLKESKRQDQSTQFISLQAIKRAMNAFGCNKRCRNASNLS